MANNWFSMFVKWNNLTSFLWLFGSASTNIVCNSSEWHGDLWSVSAHQMHSMLFIIFCFIQRRKNCCRMQMSMPIMILQRKCTLMLGVLPLSPILRLLFALYFWWMGYHPCFFVIEGFLLFWGMHISFQQSVFIIIMDPWYVLLSH